MVSTRTTRCTAVSGVVVIDYGMADCLSGVDAGLGRSLELFLQRERLWGFVYLGFTGIGYAAGRR